MFAEDRVQYGVASPHGNFDKPYIVSYPDGSEYLIFDTQWEAEKALEQAKGWMSGGDLYVVKITTIVEKVNV